MKPYSTSCDENREPILAVIQPLLTNCCSVLEIGSGTGQHAVYFAEKMPHLVWHTSDCTINHAGINMWLQQAELANTREPVELDVSSSTWPQPGFEAVFSANTAHIMHWPDVEAMFTGIGTMLSTGGRFLLYGPFNYGNRYTSESNARFDNLLKSRDPYSGIRNFEDLDTLAHHAGMVLRNDYEMPANNRILYWEKTNTS